MRIEVIMLARKVGLLSTTSRLKGGDEGMFS